jgi:hypothetical protein
VSNFTRKLSTPFHYPYGQFRIKREQAWKFIFALGPEMPYTCPCVLLLPFAQYELSFAPVGPVMWEFANLVNEAEMLGAYVHVLVRDCTKQCRLHTGYFWNAQPSSKMSRPGFNSTCDTNYNAT